MGEGVKGFALAGSIWYAYALFQLVNPEAVSRIAWFYAMRGVSLYMLLTIPLVFIIFDKEKDLYVFLKLWAVFGNCRLFKGNNAEIYRSGSLGAGLA